MAAAVYEPVQRYLLRRAGPDDAADVLSDTLLVLWRRLDDVPDDPVPWSLGVARRTLANHRRTNARHLGLVRRTAQHQQFASNGDPQDDIERGDPDVEAALRALTEAEAEIVHLWAWDGLEPREIALVVGTSPNAVSVALARAKRKLAERLDGEYSEHGQHEGHDARHMRRRQNPDGAGHFRSTGTKGRREMPDE